MSQSGVSQPGNPTLVSGIAPPLAFSTAETQDALPVTRPHAEAMPSPAGTATPAGRLPASQLYVAAAWYAGVAGLASVLLFFGLRLDRADLRAPLYYDMDSLLILPMVKATLEHGFGGHWHIARLSAPDGLELYDFPVIDHLHFLLLWLLGFGISDLSLVYNLYFLLTFPLTAVVTTAVFRRLGLSFPAAAVGGLLYAFLPYHYQRWENHYFLAAYWLVPLSLLPAFAICAGRLPFFRQAGGSYHLRLRTWGTVWIVLLAAATASAGAYYAFFACAFIMFAGCYAAVAKRGWQPLAAAAGVAGLIVAFGLVNHLPTLLYQAKSGRNPVTDRMPYESDVYGLKLAHLVMPIEDHRVSILARCKWLYNEPNRPEENENRAAALGVVGAAGFVGLIALLILPGRRPWPYGPLAAMTAFGVLVATIGGVGSLFNLFVTSQIRGYNRISVFLAVFCLFAVMWAIESFLALRRRTVSQLHLSYVLLPFIWLFLLPGRAIGPQARAWVNRFRDRLRDRSVAAVPLVWCGVLAIGFLDQTPFSWFQSEIVKTIDEQASRFRADARFFAEIEQSLSPGAMVFCLPYVPFPEFPPVNRMPVYEPVRGYLHTRTLSWCAAAIKGRETDAWLQDVTFKSSEEFLQRIVYRGFEGLFIDCRGYATVNGINRAHTLVSELNEKYARLIKKEAARLPELVHSDGRQLFLDLRPYRDALRAVSPTLFELRSREEAEWPAVIWLNGFFCPDPTGEDHSIRYAPPDATAWIINRSDHARRFRLTMTFCPMGPGTFGLRVSGLADDTFDLDKKALGLNPRKEGLERHLEVEVPPGRGAVRIRCTPPADFIPSDGRRLCYYIKDFRIEEMK